MTPKNKDPQKFLNWTSLKLKLLNIKRHNSEIENKSQTGRKHSNIYLTMGQCPEYTHISYNQQQRPFCFFTGQSFKQVFNQKEINPIYAKIHMNK